MTHIKNDIFFIKFNRPDKRNCLNFATIESLSCLLDEIDADDRINKIVLYGEGNNFCSGFDLNEVKAENRDKLAELIRSNGDWFRSSKLMIAFVQGYAVGLGFELAVSCDVLIADESCKFGFLNRRFGVPSFLPLVRLRNLIGRLKAIELLDNSSLINSQEALNLGLIKHLVLDDQEKDLNEKKNDSNERADSRKDFREASFDLEGSLANKWGDSRANLNMNLNKDRQMTNSPESLMNQSSSLDKLERLLDSVQLDRRRLEIERGELNSSFRLDSANKDRLPDEWASHGLQPGDYNPNARHGKFDLSFWNEIQRKLTN